MSDRSHEEIRELLGAYALDAVDDVEGEAVLRHLTNCAACAEEVAQHHEIAAMLGNTGGDAPPHVWDRIEAHLTIASTGPGRKDAGLIHPGAHRPRATRMLAVAAAVFVIGLAVAVGFLQSKVSDLQGEPSQQLVIRAAQNALRDPAASRVTLRSPAHDALAEVAVLPSGGAYLLNEALPALPSSRTYQLWGKVGDHLVSLGLLGSHPTAIAFEVGKPDAVSSYAVTAEHAGGVVQSSHVPVAVGSI